MSDAVKSCTQINHFKHFMDTVYALYSQTPKCQQELAECAKEFEVQLNRIGRVLYVGGSLLAAAQSLQFGVLTKLCMNTFVGKLPMNHWAVSRKQNFRVWPRNWKVQSLLKTSA